MRELRWRRGSMPDVPLHERERDTDLLAGSAFDPRGGGPRIIEFSDLHQDLQEVLVRMDDTQVANLKSGLHILVRLEPEDFKKVRSFLKLVSVVSFLVRIMKWSVGSFLAGLAAVALAGDQLLKIWGWVLSAIKVVRP